MPTNPFTTYTNLSCSSLNTKILFTTDDFFALAENLLNPSSPTFDPNTFTQSGKEMDGWETRRKRTPGHDWCIIRLGLPGCIKGFEVDTAFFTGNQVPGISVQAATIEDDLKLVRRSELGSACTEHELGAAESVGSDKWEEVVPYTPLAPGYDESRYHYITCLNSTSRFTHLRVNYYPDGGVARFKAFGLVSKDWSKVSPNEVIDLAHVENGGRSISFSNAHYGHPRNLIAPGRSLTMAGGWETARNPDRPKIYVPDPTTKQLVIPGKHWTILSLGHSGTAHQILIDTHRFKGNYPESCLIEGASLLTSAFDLAENNSDQIHWFTLIPRTKLGPDREVTLSVVEECMGKRVTHVRVTMFPDGGISRIRVFGRICD